MAGTQESDDIARAIWGEFGDRLAEFDITARDLDQTTTLRTRFDFFLPNSRILSGRTPRRILP
jgi:hypothetical protein